MYHGRFGKTLLRSEFAFALDEHAVHLGERSRSQSGAAIGIRVLESFLVFRGAARRRIGGVFERREIQIRRNIFLSSAERTVSSDRRWR